MKPEQITAQWIREHLQWEISNSDSISIERIGLGQGLLGRIYRIKCANQSFVFKCPPPKDSIWYQFFLETNSLAREVQAYQLLEQQREYLQNILPQCYWSACREDGTGALAIEDLTQKNAIIAPFSKGLNLEQVSATLRSLAVLHSLFVSVDSTADSLNPPYSWLYSATSTELYSLFTEGIMQSRQIVMERFQTEFSRESLVLLEKWNIKEMVVEAHRGCRLISLCHGDVWANNVMYTYNGPSPEAVLLDWQFVMWGNPLIDVAILILSSMDTRLRRLYTTDLIQTYYTTLIGSMTSSLNYSFEECKADFKKAFKYGVLVSLSSLEAYIGDLSESQSILIVKRLQSILEDFQNLATTNQFL